MISATYECLKHNGITPVGVWAIQLPYTDLMDVSDNCLEAVMFCDMKGLVSGQGHDCLAPQKEAKLVEACSVLERLHQILIEKN